MDSGPHLVLAHVVKPEVQREPPRGRLEHQLRYAGFPKPGLQPLVQIQVVHPVWNRHLQDVGRLLPLLLRQVECQPPPHVGRLHVARPEQQLPRVKRPTRRVANLPVGLHDALLHVRIRAGEVSLHLLANSVKHLGEQALVFFRERQGVPVAGEPFHEVLRQVRPAHHAQLAEERQAAVVQPEHRLRPHLAGGASGRVGFRRLRFQRFRLRRGAPTASVRASPGRSASSRRSTLPTGCTRNCRRAAPAALSRTAASAPPQIRGRLPGRTAATWRRAGQRYSR